ncbi:MAG: DUF1972 domain-containing protein [Candidatus Bathyarchaeia archaeon]
MLPPKAHTERRASVVLIGSRGIPPRYGGAETFAYELSTRLKEHFNVYVTCESKRFGVDEYHGLKRLHIYAPQPRVTTIPVIYDIIATLYSMRKVRADVVFYVAPDGVYAALIAKLMGSRVIINTDGLEWKRLFIRRKFVSPFQKPMYLLTALLLLIAEFLACKIPDVTIADSLAIMYYLKRQWKPRKIVYVAYGIRSLPALNQEVIAQVLQKYGLSPFGYYLTVGRFVAENNFHAVIQAYKQVKAKSKLVFIGFSDPQNHYARYLIKLKNGDPRIMLLPPLYDLSKLAALRSSCRAYIHPYTVGGTNPSLLEQLQYRRPIIAYDAPFHREILRHKGIYFRTVSELAEIITKIESSEAEEVAWEVPPRYTWSWVSSRYEELFVELLKKGRAKKRDVS